MGPRHGAPSAYNIIDVQHIRDEFFQRIIVVTSESVRLKTPLSRL